MKKIFIPIISIIFCTQQIQSMEICLQPKRDPEAPLSFKKFCKQQEKLENAKKTGDHAYQKHISENKCHTCNSPLNKCLALTTPSDDNDGYTVVTKEIAHRPKPTPIAKEFNELSEKLAVENITNVQIQEWVKQGAKVNYRPKGSSWPLVFRYAISKSPYAIANMETVITLRAAIHNIEDEEHTPLTIALENDHAFDWDKRDFSDMIQCLIPHEDPIVTIYEKTEYRDGKPFSWITYEQEKKIREYLISSSFYYPNITTIKMLLDLKLMTPNRGLREFAHRMKPNKEVLDLLLAYKAHNGGEVLPKVMYSTFPYDQYIEFMRQICAAKVFNREVLKRMETIKKDVDAIVQDLEANQPK